MSNKKTFSGTCIICNKEFTKSRAVGASRWNDGAKTLDEMTPYQKWCYENANFCEKCETPYTSLECPGYKADHCGRQVKTDGLCGRCYVKKWKDENPEKYKAQKDKRKKQVHKFTLVLDFEASIGRNPRGFKTRKDIYLDLERIAKEEMRPITTQAIYFIAQEIERHKRRKKIVDEFFDNSGEDDIIEEELEDEDIPDDLVETLDQIEYSDNEKYD